jgi:two-component system, LytTR family, sensor kinase
LTRPAADAVDTLNTEPGPFRVPIWLLVSVAWLVPAILAMLDDYAQGRLGNGPAPNPWELVWRGVDWLIYGALTPVVFVLARRYPLRQGVTGRHLILHFVFALVLCGVWAGLGVLLRRALVAGPEGAISLQYFVSWLFITLPFGVAIYFFVVGVEHAAYYFSAIRERDTHAARLSAQVAEARLGALQMQLHPHFLFNSLNAIGVLVRDQDSAAASRMVELLSDVLRQVLRAGRVQETSLTDELTFVRNYLAIEQVRFADRLQVDFDVDPAVLAAAVPTFVLQPIIENAMRHGIAKQAGAGTLRVVARREGSDLVLVVSDNGPGPGPPSAVDGAPGLGLANTRARLATLYGDRARLALEAAATGGTVVTLRFPYRESPPRTERAPSG